MSDTHSTKPTPPNSGHDPQTAIDIVAANAQLLLGPEPIDAQEAAKRILAAAAALRDTLDLQHVGTPHPEPRHPTTTPRVLLVDDNEPLRTLLRATLGPEGYELVEASDGEQALEALKTNELSLILLDWNMPRRSGKDVLAEVRRRTPTTRVVVITGDDRQRDQATALHADAFLVKPFSPRELLDIVHQLLS